MDAITRKLVPSSSSVQGSETTVDHFGPLHRPTPRWADTPPQARVHLRFSRQRTIILDAISANTDTDMDRRRRRLEACCVCPMFCLNSQGGVSVAPGMCRDRLCPLCADSRGRVVQARVEAAISEMDQTRFLTLTVRSTGEPLAQLLDHVYASFRRMRQHRAWKAHVRGGIAVLEVTRNPKTGHWHPHLHVLIDGTYFDQRAIKAAWLEATGDSDIVDIRAVISRRAAARYVSAYVAKPADVEEWPQCGIVEYARALHGRRLVIAFGSMHGKLGEPDDTGDRPQLVGLLCSALRLHAARNRRCPYASIACELLGRCGGMCERATGNNVRSALSPRDPLSVADVAVLVTCLKRVAGDESAWLPEVEPNRKFNGGGCGGQRPRDATLRIWEDDPHSGCLKLSRSVAG